MTDIGRQIGIAKRPTYNGKDTDIINGLAFSVSANTKHPEEATDFALWLGSEEAQKINGEAGVCISARNDCQQYFVDAHEGLNCQIFLDNVVNAELLPHLQDYFQLGQVEKKSLSLHGKAKLNLRTLVSLLQRNRTSFLKK